MAGESPNQTKLFAAKEPKTINRIKANVFTLIPHYDTFDPGETGLSGCKSAKVSPSFAAKSIPSDVCPMSFAGFRFATTTTCFPTSNWRIVLSYSGNDLPDALPHLHLKL